MGDARSKRLGAMQRKFPGLGIGLLYVLALNSVSSFALLSSGTLTPSVVQLHSLIFAGQCGVHMLVLQVIQELWRKSGGVFNVNDALQQMVMDMENELDMRIIQAGLVWT